MGAPGNPSPPGPHPRILTNALVSHNEPLPTIVRQSIVRWRDWRFAQLDKNNAIFGFLITRLAARQNFAPYFGNEKTQSDKKSPQLIHAFGRAPPELLSRTRPQNPPIRLVGVHGQVPRAGPCLPTALAHETLSRALGQSGSPGALAWFPR